LKGASFAIQSRVGQPLIQQTSKMPPPVTQKLPLPIQIKSSSMAQPPNAIKASAATKPLPVAARRMSLSPATTLASSAKARAATEKVLPAADPWLSLSALIPAYLAPFAAPVSQYILESLIINPSKVLNVRTGQDGKPAVNQRPGAQLQQLQGKLKLQTQQQQHQIQSRQLIQPQKPIQPQLQLKQLQPQQMQPQQQQQIHPQPVLIQQQPASQSLSPVVPQQIKLQQEQPMSRSEQPVQVKMQQPAHLQHLNHHQTKSWPAAKPELKPTQSPQVNQTQNREKQVRPVLMQQNLPNIQDENIQLRQHEYEAQQNLQAEQQTLKLKSQQEQLARHQQQFVQPIQHQPTQQHFSQPRQQSQQQTLFQKQSLAQQQLLQQHLSYLQQAQLQQPVENALSAQIEKPAKLASAESTKDKYLADTKDKRAWRDRNSLFKDAWEQADLPPGYPAVQEQNDRISYYYRDQPSVRIHDGYTHSEHQQAYGEQDEDVPMAREGLDSYGEYVLSFLNFSTHNILLELTARLTIHGFDFPW
jgi:hypothetical protein